MLSLYSLNATMANRINLGGFYPSKGEQSAGELRARYFVEYSNATANKATEIFANNPDDYNSPRDVIAEMLSGELDEELSADNEVDPDEFDREAWLESQEEVEAAEADD